MHSHEGELMVLWWTEFYFVFYLLITLHKFSSRLFLYIGNLINGDKRKAIEIYLFIYLSGSGSFLSQGQSFTSE